MQFFGRRAELAQLKEIYERKKFSFITIQGRRRIGKSSLIAHFSKIYGLPLFVFQGLSPRENQGNQDQLDHFGKTLAKYLGLKSIQFDDWQSAFDQMAQLSRNQKVIVLLDEISWMGGKDPDFAGKLKIACDKLNQENAKILLIACGSVSSWIQKNILNSTGFVGRVSAEIRLGELDLKDSMQMLKARNKALSDVGGLQLLSLVGGVPKYLEEINPKESIEFNINQFFLNVNGFFFREFDSIFSDIFGKRHVLYKKMLKALVSAPMTLSELAKVVDIPLNGDATEFLNDLEQAGFVKRYYSWKFTGGRSKNYVIRIVDHYTRFYLKFVEPQQHKLKTLSSLRNAVNSNQFAILFGLQLENLILNNLDSLLQELRIDPADIDSVGPYYQAATKAKRGVQIDLLIQCKRGLLHACEIKSAPRVDRTVIDEVKIKNKYLKRPKGFTILNSLVYLGELSEAVEAEDLFHKTVKVSNLLR